MARGTTTRDIIVHTAEGPLRHSERYLTDSPGVISGVHVRKGSFDYEHLKRALRDDVTYARAVAAVVDASKEVWDRAEAITEEGTFLADKIEGFISRLQLHPDVQGELDLIEETRTTLALAPDAPGQFSSIQQNASAIASLVQRYEFATVVSGTATSATSTTISDSTKDFLAAGIRKGFLVEITSGENAKEIRVVTNVTETTLTVDETWTATPSPGDGYRVSSPSKIAASAITQTADFIESEVARVEANLESDDPSEWYSSIKQTADSIASVVAKLSLEPGDPDWSVEQFTSIKQTYDEITSVVATLNLTPEDEDWETKQYSSIKQTVESIESIVATLNDDPDAIGQFSSIKQTADAITSIVAKLEADIEDPDQFSIIEQLIDEINLRVHKDGVVAAINLSEEGVRILGDRIRLDGDVEVDGTFTINSFVTEISGIDEDGGLFLAGNVIQLAEPNDGWVTTITPQGISSQHPDFGTFYALRVMDIGEADDADEVSFPGFATSPKIIVMPIDLQTYESSESGNDQFVRVGATNIHQDNGVWKATILCRLTKGASFSQDVGATQSVGNYWTSAETDPLGMSTTSIRVSGYMYQNISAKFGFPGGTSVTFNYEIQTRRNGGAWSGSAESAVYTVPSVPFGGSFFEVKHQFSKEVSYTGNPGNLEIRVRINSIVVSNTGGWDVGANGLYVANWGHTSRTVLHAGRAQYIAFDGGN